MKKLVLIITAITTLSSLSAHNVEFENLCLELITGELKGLIQPMAQQSNSSQEQIDKAYKLLKEGLLKNKSTISEAYKDFTQTELEEILTFKQSPVGKKYEGTGIYVMHTLAPTLQSMLTEVGTTLTPAIPTIEPSSHITPITTQQELENLIEKNTSVVVKFHADWCGPCKMLNEPYNKLADELHGSVAFVSVDLDKAQELAKKYDVTNIPAIKVFSNGSVSDELVGFQPEKLVEMVTKLK